MPLGRCMPNFIQLGHLVWSGGCTKVCRTVAVIFLSPNSQKRSFWDFFFRIFEIFEKTSIRNDVRKVHAKFYRCSFNSLAWVLYQSFSPGRRNFSKSQFTKNAIFGKKNLNF